MSGYEFRVSHTDKTTKEHITTAERGLSYEQVSLRAQQYQNGENFILKGKVIDPYDVEWIRITDTNSLSLKEVTSDFINSPPRPKLPKSPTITTQASLSKNIFVVHGRDHKPLEELKAMLYGFGLKPIVLHEQPSGSRTIVEKLEKYSDVGYAFVILTPDDVGGPSRDRKILRFEGKERARQNVILEFGYFIGRLGRDRVCCLHKGDVELPSDMHGIVYIRFKESVKEVQDRIMNELEDAGYDNLNPIPTALDEKW